MNYSLDRWINAQRIAFAAYRVNLPLSKTLPHEPRAYRLMLEQSLALDSSHRYKRTLATLPPTTLELLLDIEDKNIHRRLRDLRPSWKQALQRLVGTEENELSLIRAAIIFAHLLMLGPAKPISISRLGRNLLSRWWMVKQWRKNGVEEDFKTLCLSLRHPTLNTEKKIEAIELFRQSSFRWRELGLRGLPLWTHVENVLYHHLFCWPLLVFGGGATPPAFSLPVAVDAYFDGKGGDNNPIIDGDDDRVIQVAPWREPLRTSITAAKRLWSSQHENYGAFCEKVQTASIVFDFTYARRILGDIARLPEDYPLELDQGSMEAYFTQIILSRFLGYPIIPGNVATGALGSLTTNPANQVLDYEVDWPSGVREKLTYVFKSHLFQRAVVPALSEGELEKKPLVDFLKAHRKQQNVEINYAKYLRNFTDALQPGPWRWNQYVRCPDVAWAMDNSGQGLPEVTSEKVQRCLVALQRNASPVLELSNDVSALDVAAALRHLNTSRYTEHLPLLSCAFLRVTQEEYNQRFWYTLWSLFGAPDEVQQQFYHSPTIHLAADHLVAAFNHFSPSEADPRFRAPDILIVIGTLSWADRQSSVNPLSEPLNYSLLIAELQSRTEILPVLDAGATQRCPQTRIIIVPLAQPVEETIPGGGLEPKDRHLMARLSIFRFGFTQTMVAPILWQEGFYAEEVRSKLRHLVDTGHLRYANGTYHIPGQVGFDSAPKGNGYTRALHHFNVALAYAPYLNKRHQTAINFYLAHQPYMVHEAQYHLDRAKQYIKEDRRNPKEDKDLYGKIIAGILRTVQYYDTQGWHTVAKLLDSDLPAEDAHLLATEMLAAAERTGATLHPRCWTVAAQAAYQVWQKLIVDNGRFEPTVTDMRQVVCERYEAALRACAAFPTQCVVNRIMVLTRYGDFLLQDARDDDERTRLSEINHEAWELIQEHGDMGAAFASWFERFGDQHKKHQEAAAIYARGVQADPHWYTSWIKWVGASRNTQEVLQTLKSIDGGILFKNFCQRLRRTDARLTSDRHLAHLKVRIEKGYQVFQRECASDC